MTGRDHNLLILAGGLGTRLWPMSRRMEPKQFLHISSDLTMLEQTVRRVESLFPPERRWVIVKPCHRERMNRISSILAENIIIEPEPRGTAAAICLGVSHIASRCGEGMITVMPSDHLIEDDHTLPDILEAGMACAARTGSMVLYGITPSRPETAYGYIETGDREHECNGRIFCRVSGFHEKPDMDTARRYCMSEHFLWNSGMFTFSPEIFMRLLEKYRPDMWKITKEILRVSIVNDSEAEKLYSGFDDVSIDHALVETVFRADKGTSSDCEIMVTECDFMWHDIGIWETFFSIFDSDMEGNVISENCIGIDCNGTMLFSEDGKTVIGAVGLRDMVVVAKGNAVLVCPRERLEEVRRIVKILKSKSMKDYI